MARKSVVQSALMLLFVVALATSGCSLLQATPSSAAGENSSPAQAPAAELIRAPHTLYDPSTKPASRESSFFLLSSSISLPWQTPSFQHRITSN